MSSDDKSKDNPSHECPVCYERMQNPSISERKLSCGHSFCHDCLVKYLITARKEGSIKKNIICPLCRYVTFLSKRGLIMPPRTEDMNQILEVPLTPHCPRHSIDLESQNNLIIPIPETTEENGPSDLPSCTCQDDSNPELAGHNCGSQVFFISDQGQPMECEDIVDTQAQPVDARVNCCRSPALIMIMLMILLVAVISAVIPWILLGRRT
ncbi:RING finger protein 222 [Bombina bombina]|uniref:RING finger protein 222 n=1 Tax=Bombina bombina TaxID=8345 RepID=UPI00235ADC37|nr:RING finger protein 222 [Bombina bombina]XP_053552811.1 RING finger protein 222 [Bombina bombina]